MRLDRRDVLSSLESKGFVRREGANHSILIYRNMEGKKTEIRTIVSRGRNYRVLGDDIVGSMARSCKLSTSQFAELVDCSISQDDYDQFVRE